MTISRKHPRASSKRTLLIADDEPGVRQVIRMTLLDERYEILEAIDGEQALALARAELPAVVLLDVMMPLRSGIEVCRALKADRTTADIVVLMLTAQARSSDISAGLAAGADDYLTKPFSPLSLLRRVDEVFGVGRPARAHRYGARNGPMIS